MITRGLEWLGLVLIPGMCCVAGFDKTTDVKSNDKFVPFSVKLKQGRTKLTAEFLDAKGHVICGAMYVKVVRKQL